MQNRFSKIILLGYSLSVGTFGFVPSSLSGVKSIQHKSFKNRLFSSTNNDINDNNVEVLSGLLDRRSVLLSGVLASIASFNPPAYADEESPITSSDVTGPVAVIGASGKCGKLCCEILTQKQLKTRAITRSGRSILDGSSDYISYAPGDVTSYDSIKEAVKGCSGVIFAASASGKKKGGDPEHVDFLGLYNTAKACLDCDVPKLVGT